MTETKGIVQIHGKDYMTVARRVELWHEDTKVDASTLGIRTEIISHDPIVVKATIYWKKKEFTAHSSVSKNTYKQIEKQNPYEVAETSAVGRALGFAGYGLIESIASADEMQTAVYQQADVVDSVVQQAPLVDEDPSVTPTIYCAVCGEEANEKQGVSRNGKAYHGIFCLSGDKSHTKWIN